MNPLSHSLDNKQEQQKTHIHSLKKLDITGLGNAMIDYIYHIDDVFFAKIVDWFGKDEIAKGHMHLIDDTQLGELLQIVQEEGLECSKSGPGGSIANMIKTYARLQHIMKEECSAGYLGTVGEGQYGQMFINAFKRWGITSSIDIVSNAETGMCIAFVFPNGQRMFFTHLGAGQKLSEENIKNDKNTLDSISDTVVIEGYEFDTPNQIIAAQLMIEKAKTNEKELVIDISDPFCVAKHKSTFNSLMQNDMDIVVANHEEMSALIDVELGSNLEEVMHNSALQAFFEASHLSICVVKCGANGAIALTREGAVAVKGNEVVPRDTTAAGDTFLGAFMYKYKELQKSGQNIGPKQIQLCLEHATYCARKIVTVDGSELPAEFDEEYKIFSRLITTSTQEEIISLIELEKSA